MSHSDNAYKVGTKKMYDLDKNKYWHTGVILFSNIGTAIKLYGKSKIFHHFYVQGYSLPKH